MPANDPSNPPDPSRVPTGVAPAVHRLQRVAYLMDSSIRLPGGYRIGWDGIVGLIPGIGDIAGLFVSSGILVATARLGVPRVVLARMALNIGVETLVGSVPIVGDLFDMAFKANQRNLALATRALETPVATRRRSGAALAAVMLAVLAMFLLLAWAVVFLIGGLVSLLF